MKYGFITIKEQLLNVTNKYKSSRFGSTFSKVEFILNQVLQIHLQKAV